MTIDEAIAELAILVEVKERLEKTYQADALRLGIEALKRVKGQYDPDHQMMRQPLPGETK